MLTAFPQKCLIHSLFLKSVLVYYCYVRPFCSVMLHEITRKTAYDVDQRCLIILFKQNYQCDNHEVITVGNWQKITGHFSYRLMDRQLIGYGVHTFFIEAVVGILKCIDTLTVSAFTSHECCRKTIPAVSRWPHVDWSKISLCLVLIVLFVASSHVLLGHNISVPVWRTVYYESVLFQWLNDVVNSVFNYFQDTVILFSFCYTF